MFYIRLYLEKKLKNVGGRRAGLKEKKHLFCFRAYFEGNLSRIVRVRSCARANDAKKHAQCNIKELH